MARRSGVQLEHSLVSGALKSASFTKVGFKSSENCALSQP
jgi:hypothetical protein